MEQDTVLWIAPELNNRSYLELLANPDRLYTFPGCKLIKDQRKIKLGRVPLELDGKLMTVYLKRYNSFSWRYRLGSLFMRSEALKSWRGATLLSRAGFNVGKPLAAIEHRCYGMLQKSFYLSAGVADAHPADVFWDLKAKELTGKELYRFQRSLMRELARLFSSLHEKNIYHKDLKDANILVQERPSGRHYYFTDLEQVSILKKLSWRRRIKNLMQLDRTLWRRFSQGRRLYFLSEYLGERSLDRAERRKWIRRILGENRRPNPRSSPETVR